MTAIGVDPADMAAQLSEPLVLLLYYKYVGVLTPAPLRQDWSLNFTARGTTEVLATACSGSGSPSFALGALVGRDNFREHISSESHEP